MNMDKEMPDRTSDGILFLFLAVAGGRMYDNDDADTDDNEAVGFTTFVEIVVLVDMVVEM
jgi:hypothetical protein